MAIGTEADVCLLRIKQMYNIILQRNKELLYQDNKYKDLSSMTDSRDFNFDVLRLEEGVKNFSDNMTNNFLMFDGLLPEELYDFDEKLTDIILQLEIPIDTVEMISNLNQGDYIISSSAGSVVAVGRKITYRAVQIVKHFISADSKYHYRWYCENDVLTRHNYSSTASSVPDVAERDGFMNWLDETFGNPSDIELTATYPGVHDIKVDVYLDDKYLSTATFRQTVVEGDPDIIAMSYNEKLLIVLERCSFYDALLNEVGGVEGIITLVGSMIVCAGVLAAIAATGYGLAAEIIAGILAALFLGVSVSKVLHGIYKLVEALELTRLAASEGALNDASKIMEEAIAEIGINTLFAILCYLGVKRARTQVRTRIANGERVLVRNVNQSPNTSVRQRLTHENDPYAKIPKKYQARADEIIRDIEAMQPAKREAALKLIDELFIKYKDNRILKTMQDHHWLKQELVNKYSILSQERCGLDLISGKENLSMIAGHNGNHLGSYRLSIIELITKLETKAKMRGLNQAQIKAEVTNMINDIKVGVDNGTIKMNNTEYIILENISN